MIVYDLVGVCDACADGNHGACLRLRILIGDGMYDDPDAEAACGCTICWGRSS